MSTRKQLAFAVAMLLCVAVPKTSHAAGNVLAFVEDGMLYLIGDKLPNHFFIRPWTGGAIQVNGVATGSGGTPSPTGWDDTLINGAWQVEFEEAIDELRVITGGGSDQVHLLQGLTGIACDISTGAGADRVITSYGRFESLSINTGRDPDDVLIGATTIVGDVDINTGHGGDRVRFQVSTVEGVTNIDAGGGDDHVTLFGFVGAPAFFADLWVGLGQGDDTVTFQIANFVDLVTATGNALFVGGQGHDVVQNPGVLTVLGDVDFFGFEIP